MNISIHRFSGSGDASQAVAQLIAVELQNAIATRGRGLVAVSGGNTPKIVFPYLASCDLDWPHVTVTLTDERWVAPDDPASTEGLVRNVLLRGPAASARFVGLWNDAPGPGQGLTDIEASLEKCGWPPDITYLGMGPDGHIASLFPDDASWIDADNRCVAIAPAPDQNREPRISLTPHALLSSRKIVLLITGPEKQAVFEAAQKAGPLINDADTAETGLPVRLVLHQNKVPVEVFIASQRIKK